VSDDKTPWYSPGVKLPPRTKRRPAELLFEFVRDSDHAHFRCELRYRGFPVGFYLSHEQPDDSRQRVRFSRPVI
jgi:hypothetical protein